MTSQSVVLNVGCGTGSLAFEIAAAGKHIHGVDFSKEMIRIARSRLTASEIGNISFYEDVFDANFDVFPVSSLDGICAYSVLHLMANRHEALAKMYALLKPGGFLIASTVCLKDSWFPYRAFIAAMRFVGKAPDVSIISKSQLRDEMEHSGFTDVIETDVGAESTISFIVARKPEAAQTQTFANSRKLLA